METTVRTRFDQWTQVLEIDDRLISTLQVFLPVIEPQMGRVMDTVYERLTNMPQAMGMFKDPESMARAREQQKNHWLTYVFRGRFDAAYLEASQAIGRTHYRLGVDLRLYVGAYSVVQGELVRIISHSLDGRPDDMARYLSALNAAIFLDMGLAVSVYYDALLSEIESMAHELNFSLARAGEFRDNETGKHIIRMSRMCAALARAAGQEVQWAHMLQVAAPLHDVGKIGVPDHVLLKPGRLTPEELTLMRAHPTIGGEIIPEHPAEVIRMAKRVSLTHHERWDGAGYPVGLKGEEIPLEGRIAAICDVYDALVSRRPYKEPWPKEKALAHLRENAGSHFDPSLIDAFFTILPEIDSIQNQFSESCEAKAAE